MSTTLETTVHIWLEGDQYVAQALPINILSSGPTPEAARAAVAEAVHVFAITAQESGTLDQILEESGYSFEGERWLAPEWVAIERQAVAV